MKRYFTVVTVAIGAVSFLLKSSKFPRTVILVWCVSSLCAFNAHIIFPYVTFLISNGTSILRVKKIVLVPTILLPTPCTSLPNSLEKDLVHFILSGPLIRWRYSCDFSVSGWTTAFSSPALMMLVANAYLFVISVSNLLGLCLRL